MQIFTTMERVIHERWDGDENNGYDIAMLKLDRPCNLPRPILALPDDQLKQGQPLVALGWGHIGPRGPRADHLQALDEFQYIPTRTCNAEDQWNGIITDSMICSIGLYGDACQSKLL